MHLVIIIRTVRSLWTWLWGRYPRSTERISSYHNDYSLPGERCESSLSDLIRCVRADVSWTPVIASSSSAAAAAATAALQQNTKHSLLKLKLDVEHINCRVGSNHILFKLAGRVRSCTVNTRCLWFHYKTMACNATTTLISGYCYIYLKENCDILHAGNILQITLRICSGRLNRCSLNSSVIHLWVESYLQTASWKACVQPRHI